MPFDWLKSLRSPSRRNNSWGSITPLEPRTLLSATPIGQEFRVNSYTTDIQNKSSIAVDADGNFVVSWQSWGQDGSGNSVYAQRYNSLGVPQGTEFLVNSYTTNSQSIPAIGMDADGNFVIAWPSYEQDGSEDSIYAQRFNALGEKQGDEFRVNSHTTDDQAFPDIAMDADGDFVITWMSFGQIVPGPMQNPSNYEIFAQRYDAAGIPQGTEFLVNSHTEYSQMIPAIAMDDDGDFVITWQSTWQDGSSLDGAATGIFAQRFDAAGVPQGSEFQVNSYTTGFQDTPSVSMDADGDFIIVWESPGQDGSSEGVFAQRYNSEGVPQGSEFQVNSYTKSFQQRPSVSMNANGEFVVAWTSSRQDGDSYGIYAQSYSAAGVPQGSEFRINSYTTGGQDAASVAIRDDGDFVISFGSGLLDEESAGIYARRFRTGHPDNLAVWRASKFYLDSNRNNVWNGPTTDTLNTFGSTTDKPLAGDWNGDAYADIAVWRNGTFYIDANGNGTWDGAATDKSFKFGLNTDTPIVGDWNGDGQDDIGVWRNGKFYLDLDGNRIWNSAVDKAFTFGSATDTPIIGDWNADGIDDLGVWRSGKFYLDLNANRAWNSGVDGIFAFGLNTDTPLIGDWNADGTDDIAVWRNGKFYQDSNGNRAWNSATDTLTTFGSTTDTPLIGYWRPKTIPGTPPNVTPAPSPTPAAPLSIQVTPTAVTPFDFSGRWNYTGDTVNGFIRVNQIGKKASTLLRIGDLEFDMQAKIKGDRLTGKFSKNLPDTKIRGKFEATRINSTTFSGLLSVSTNGNPAELPILGTRV